jgi:hypothetical protein
LRINALNEGGFTTQHLMNQFSICTNRDTWFGMRVQYGGGTRRGLGCRSAPSFERWCSTSSAKRRFFGSGCCRLRAIPNGGLPRFDGMNSHNYLSRNILEKLMCWKSESGGFYLKLKPSKKLRLPGRSFLARTFFALMSVTKRLRKFGIDIRQKEILCIASSLNVPEAAIR